jgi:hypothetical protein
MNRLSLNRILLTLRFYTQSFSMGEIATKSNQNGDKLMLCGNGG